eukprot:scaffold293206_cov32-Tisochrysis_lutea.AAC.1
MGSCLCSVQHMFYGGPRMLSASIVPRYICSMSGAPSLLSRVVSVGDTVTLDGRLGCADLCSTMIIALEELLLRKRCPSSLAYLLSTLCLGNLIAPKSRTQAETHKGLVGGLRCTIKFKSSFYFRRAEKTIVIVLVLAMEHAPIAPTCLLAPPPPRAVPTGPPQVAGAEGRSPLPGLCLCTARQRRRNG